MCTGGECQSSYCLSPGILDELGQISPTRKAPCLWFNRCLGLFVFLVTVAVHADVQQFGVSNCKSHT